MDNCHNVLKAILPASEYLRNPMRELRDELVGREIDVSKLQSLGYVKYKAKEDNKWDEWHRPYSHRSKAVVIKVSGGGFVGAVDTIQYIDLREDFGFMGPCGYIRVSDLSKKMQAIVTNDISSVTISKLPDSKEAMYRFLFKDFFSHTDLKDQECNLDIGMGYLIGKFYSEGYYDRCALFLLGTFRYINILPEPDLIADMAYYFGLLNFKDEFYGCIKRLVDLDRPVGDTCYCNIGAVLCDHLNRYEQALDCFWAALSINPHLAQAKQNIFVAGKFVMLWLVCKENVVQACELGERIIHAGGKTTEHGFYSYLGLAYEINHNRLHALECYNKSLELNPACRVARPAVERISKGIDDVSEAKRAASSENYMLPTLNFRHEEHLFNL